MAHKNNSAKEFFLVNWMVGNTCNYACSYCPDYLHNGSESWAGYIEVIQFIDRLLVAHPDKKIVFEFTGGEVSMWKHLTAVCKYLNEIGVEVGIISNGSRTLRWWKEIAPFLNRISLSYHIDSADTNHFIDVINHILKFGVLVHVNVMAVPNKFDFCFDFLKQISQIEGIGFTFQPLIKNLESELYQYDEAELKMLNNWPSYISGNVSQNGHTNYRDGMKKVYSTGVIEKVETHQLIADNSNSWFGWRCFAGVEQLIIGTDGYVYRGWCKVGGAIGHISNKKIFFPKAPVKCTKRVCHCNFDITCTKQTL